jgi:chloramphenicol-sensitive protein RarD
MRSEAALQRRGWWLGCIAFFLWGIFPLYWRFLAWLSAVDLVALRPVLTLPVLLVLLGAQGRLREFGAALRRPELVGRHALTGALIGVNWLLFVWATLHGRVVECSLGYFITPLVNIALGALWLRERLSWPQWLAVTLAGAGAVVQMVAVGHWPWIALGLCFSFGLYGLLRKTSPLDSLSGLGLETLALTPVSLAWLSFHPASRWAENGAEWALLGSMGVVTAIPLLCFASAARALPMSTVGVLQYVAPSLQFLIGWLAFGESVSPLRFASFALIWLALLIFARAAR